MTGKDKTEDGMQRKTKEYTMTFLEFKRWDLENNLPGLVNQFWMMHPKVVWAGMYYWLHYNVGIKVPYKWNAVDFQCPYSMPPSVEQKGENYKEITMIQVIENVKNSCPTRSRNSETPQVLRKPLYNTRRK
jgi:hypothetical protein